MGGDFDEKVSISPVETAAGQMPVSTIEVGREGTPWSGKKRVAVVGVGYSGPRVFESCRAVLF